MSNILKFFRRIHQTTPAFSKEDLNDDKDVYSNGKVLQNNLGSRHSSADTNYEQTHVSSQSCIKSDKKIIFKKRKNLLNPTNNNNNSPSDNECKNSFRAKLFVRPHINRFKRFHSLNNENVEQFESATATADNNNIPDNFVFERVKVKQNTRYLRHSPDRSSFDSTSPTVTPRHSLKNQQLRATASIDMAKVTPKTMQSNNISFDLKDTHFVNNNEIYALQWASNNSSALRLWDDNKNSLEDINNNNWDDDFEIHMRSSVSPMLSSISSSSTMDTWVDEEIATSSFHSNDWNDVTHGIN